MVEPRRVVAVCFPVFLVCAVVTALLGLAAIWVGELHDDLQRLAFSAGLLLVLCGLVLSGCRVVGSAPRADA